MSKTFKFYPEGTCGPIWPGVVPLFLLFSWLYCCVKKIVKMWTFNTSPNLVQCGECLYKTQQDFLQSSFPFLSSPFPNIQIFKYFWKSKKRKSQPHSSKFGVRVRFKKSWFKMIFKKVEQLWVEKSKTLGTRKGVQIGVCPNRYGRPVGVGVQGWQCCVCVWLSVSCWVTFFKKLKAIDVMRIAKFNYA